MLVFVLLEQELVPFKLGSPLFALEIRLLVILGDHPLVHLVLVGSHRRGLGLQAHQPLTKIHHLFIALIQSALIVFHSYFRHVLTWHALVIFLNPPRLMVYLVLEAGSFGNQMENLNLFRY